MTLDELLLEWSYRSERGYPSLDNPSDVLILKQILKELDLPTDNLLNNLENVYNKLSSFIDQLDGEIEIYTHAWEGGNIDHDASFVLALKLMRKYSNIKYGYQFPFYNSYKMPFNLYRIFYPIIINGNAVKYKISFNVPLGLSISPLIIHK